LDELTANGANAMLKLLEEPPVKTIFFLISHSLANTLPTVRSRARVEKMSPLNSSELRDLFYKFLPDEELTPALLRLANGSFGRIADLKLSGGQDLYEQLITVIENPRASPVDIMTVASPIGKDVALHGMILDAIYHFGCADLYPVASREIATISRLYLEPEIAIFNLIMKIKKNVN
ncbi:MAG: hypothetical protein FWC83_02485, partial [Alphaproteobacteria bacterium]|nr:hypothetical protein [Alphaproteobacteria bacterium]